MHIEYVASGDYKICAPPRSTQKLVALLGTCVGVAIYDKQSAIGGICHVLLPEPNDPEHSWNPRFYASTSLPLFVDELLKHGAIMNNLEAVVAGGSLCAPISNRDLLMDIGGRNAENVFNFLKRHQIRVEKSETGGFNTMSLSYSPATCRAEISHIFTAADHLSPAPAIDKPKTDEIERSISLIKPIPQVALKIIRLLHAGHYNQKQITEELLQDQILSAKLLGYCNSAIFGFKKPIESVERAVVVLGETSLIEAIISSSISSFLDEEQIGGYSLIKGGLLKHAIAVANIAKIVSRRLGVESGHTAYTAGLLHDIGKVVLDKFVARAQPLFYQPATGKIHDYTLLESDAFGINHQEIGHRLAKSWGLPSRIDAAIHFHHHPEMADQKYKLLAHTVYLANLLSLSFMAGIEVEQINAELFPQRMEFLGLDQKDLFDIIEQIPWNRMMYI